MDEIGYLISCGLLNEIIKHEGRSWWVYENEKQIGLDKFRGYLETNPTIQENIRKSLIQVRDGEQEPVKKKVEKQKKL